MRVRGVVVVALVALVAVLPAGSQPSVQRTTPPASAFMPKGAFGPRQVVFFGYVRSVTRRGARYTVRVDPSLILTGITASTAAVEDKVLRPGEPVPNDYYERNESRRPLTYRVPANAHVTVLTNPGSGPHSTVVAVSEFALIVKGENPRKRRGLWTPASGFWIRIAGDRALALDQAYRP